ncbi:DEAD/DEAH box helicase [Austwickia chelonae]|nr:DEAD/DEAH box helicase [Austwickia chelonae]
MDAADPLSGFSPATTEWFREAFTAPTPAQAEAWASIRTGAHTLVIAPTGSGKTLSAFLWALDGLHRDMPRQETGRRCRILYVSPLKALAADVEKNLRIPLSGIARHSERLQMPAPDIRVSVRSGDTPGAARRAFAKKGADILITTPESLFLLLTSQARDRLRDVSTVIVDEIHAVAGSKRGVHLALSLERLDALLDTSAQRIGLSATVRPEEDVGHLLAGDRPVHIVRPEASKQWDLKVVVPVARLDDPTDPGADRPLAVPDDPRRRSVWPHVEGRLVDLITEHRSTIVFTNSRRQAERLTARINELGEDRLSRTPEGLNRICSPTNTSRGAAPVLARAHHGSVSKELRSAIESDLKSGTIPAVVATGSLELGIDMGAVDLVVHVESPPSVAGGLQRIGRSGHQVGAVSTGVLLPRHRGDLLQCAVIVSLMLDGRIEAVRMPRNPLDVLAQQLVAMISMDDWSVEELHSLLRRSAPYRTLSRSALEAVLDMLSGRYPAEDLAVLRPRLVWDRLTDRLTARPGAHRLAVTSGGTIPDRGMYGVFLTGEGQGRRVGELDEEMVHESRLGDLLTLGTSTWRVEEITHDQVIVSPSPGSTGRLPFWRGDSVGRPAELGAAIGDYTRKMCSLDREESLRRAREGGLDAHAAENLVAYLEDQQAATGLVPDDRTIVVEHFQDELGDRQAVVHTPYGGCVHAPWALVIADRLRRHLGVDARLTHHDDGIVLRWPQGDSDSPSSGAFPGDGLDLAPFLTVEPEDVMELVAAQIEGTALFASRFRECAARSLLLPKPHPGRRRALWQERQRSGQLLEFTSEFTDFPIVSEAVRECLQDVFDVPALVDLMQGLRSGKITIHQVTTGTASPYAQSLLFDRLARSLYETDTPSAERRAAAAGLDSELLADLLGDEHPPPLSELLDPGVVSVVDQERQHTTPERQCRDLEDVVDMIRRFGPVTSDWIRYRTAPTVHHEVDRWLDELVAARRTVQIRLADEPRWIVMEDVGRVRDALGVTLPPGLPASLLAPVADPLGDLMSRYARSRALFTAAEAADWAAIGPAVATAALDRLVHEGRLRRGNLRPRPDSPPDIPGSPTPTDYADVEVVRLLRRRTTAALRAEVAPVPQRSMGIFLPAWQSVGGKIRGPEGVLHVIDQLAGTALPAAVWEEWIFPSRVPGYRPGDLDEISTSGQAFWQGHREASRDWRISWHPADIAPLTLDLPCPLPEGDESAPTDQVLHILSGGGSYLFRTLSAQLDDIKDQALLDTLWKLVRSGLITNGSFAPVRARFSPNGSPRRTSSPRPIKRGRLSFGAIPRSNPTTGYPLPLTTSRIPPTGAGHWIALPKTDPDPTRRTLAAAEALATRYGVVTSAVARAESIPGGFAPIYRVLSAAEDAGQIRRGYFVEGLGAAQFAMTSAVEQLRAAARRDERATDDTNTVVLAAADPANPYGTFLPWPAPVTPGVTVRSPRRAGSLVIFVGGELVLHVERSGRDVTSYATDSTALIAASRALAELVHSGRAELIQVEQVDGRPSLGSDHIVVKALLETGFRATPRGLRLRR